MKFYKAAAFYSLRGFCEQVILASCGQILSRRQNFEHYAVRVRLSGNKF